MSVIESFSNSVSVASNSFFLSLWKITWVNSQQLKTRGHVEDLTYLLFLIHLCLSHITYEWMISIQIQHQVQKFKYLKLRFKFWKSLYNMKKLTLVDKNQ